MIMEGGHVCVCVCTCGLCVCSTPYVRACTCLFARLVALFFSVPLPCCCLFVTHVQPTRQEYNSFPMSDPIPMSDYDHSKQDSEPDKPRPSASHPSSTLHSSLPRSNLPRNIRARVQGEAMEDVPAGKELHTAPEHHLAIDRAHHGVQAEKAAIADKLAVQGTLKELAKTNNSGSKQAYDQGPIGAHGRHGAANQTIYPKTMQSATNKLMDSRHRHGGAVGKTHGGFDDGSRANANE